MAQNVSNPPNSSLLSVASNEGGSRTNTTFGDWTLRCERNAGMQSSRQVCELGQMVRKQGEKTAMAQIAIGRVDSGNPLHLTVVVPMGVTLQGRGAKMAMEGKEVVSLDLPWTRCIPGGCFASAALSSDTIRKFKATTVMASLTYRDMDYREVKLPISFRGFGEALEALGREQGN